MALLDETIANGPVIAPRVNIPYTPALTNVPVSERAVVWFGQVGPVEDNYVDARLIYNDQDLLVTLHVFDRLLRYDKTSVLTDLTNWDAATLFLNTTGNNGAVPASTAYKFVGQLNFNEARGSYQTAYQGNQSGWTGIPIPFNTNDGWQGQGPNDAQEDNGWNITFRIPFSSLGLAGPPAKETVWGIALAVHDRDAATDDSIPDKIWPAAMDANQPSTWAQLHFGLPTYVPPPSTPGSSVTIRHGLNGSTVVDGQVGGNTTCANALWPDFWPVWGSQNYQGSLWLNIQNQWNLGDWPCFSKAYLTFPLDDIPASKSIISATLTLYHFGNSEPSEAQPSIIQVFTVADTWNEASLTWNSAPQAVENVSRTMVNPITVPPWPNLPVEWSVSSAVSKAYQARQPLQLALYSADNAKHSGKYFRSSDVADPSIRPTLTVLWGDPIDNDAGTNDVFVYLPLIVSKSD